MTRGTLTLACRWALCVAVCGAVAWPTNARADSPAMPTAYAQVVGAQESAVFVMLPGECRNVERQVEISRDELARIEADASAPESRPARQSWNNNCATAERRTSYGSMGGKAFARFERSAWTYRAADAISGLQGYAASGLYNNDGSTTPRWTVDWYAFDVRVTADGEHLVRFGPWAGGVSDLAIAFYERGHLLRAYRIDELVSEPDQLPRSVSHLTWLGSVRFDARRKILLLRTLTDDDLAFDVATGKKLYKHKEAGRLSGTIVGNTSPKTLLRNLHVCWSEHLLVGRAAEGAPPGFEAVSLHDVKTIVRSVGPAHDVVLRDGSLRRISFTGQTPSLCGQAGYGDPVSFSMDQVAEAEIHF